MHETTQKTNLNPVAYTSALPTYAEVCASNPDSMFVVGCVEDGVVDDVKEVLFSILEYNGLDTDIPKVLIANPHPLKMNARRVLDNEGDNWLDNWGNSDDWQLQYSPELLSKLQAVLDEIVEYNKSANIFYTEGKPIDITEVWQQVKLEYIKSLEVGNEHD